MNPFQIGLWRNSMSRGHRRPHWHRLFSRRRSLGERLSATPTQYPTSQTFSVNNGTPLCFRHGWHPRKQGFVIRQLSECPTIQYGPNSSNLPGAVRLGTSGNLTGSRNGSGHWWLFLPLLPSVPVRQVAHVCLKLRQSLRNV